MRQSPCARADPRSMSRMWITRQPETMRLERERAGGWDEDEIQAHHSTMRETFDRLDAAGYFIQILQISHLDFTDAPLWSPALGWLGVTGPKDGSYAHAIINDYAVSFFGRHLTGADAPLLDLLTGFAGPQCRRVVRRVVGDHTHIGQTASTPSLNTSPISRLMM